MPSSSEFVTSLTGGPGGAAAWTRGAWTPTTTTPNTVTRSINSSTNSTNTTPTPPISSLQFLSPSSSGSASFPSYAHTPSSAAGAAVVANSDARISGKIINHTTTYQNNSSLGSSPSPYSPSPPTSSSASPPYSIASSPTSGSFSPPVPPKSYPLPFTHFGNSSASRAATATAPYPYPSPHPFMGHSQSKPKSPPHSSVATPTRTTTTVVASSSPLITTSTSTSSTPNTPTSTSGSASRLRRAFAGRRKKSEDAVTLFASTVGSGVALRSSPSSSLASQHQQNRVDPVTSSSTSSTSSSTSNSTSTPSPSSRAAHVLSTKTHSNKQLSLLATHVFSGASANANANKKDPKTPQPTSPPPLPPAKDVPPLPSSLVARSLSLSPKHVPSTPVQSQSQSRQSQDSQPSANLNVNVDVDVRMASTGGSIGVSSPSPSSPHMIVGNGSSNGTYRSSIIPLSPGISSAVTYMRGLREQLAPAAQQEVQGQEVSVPSPPVDVMVLPSSPTPPSSDIISSRSLGGVGVIGDDSHQYPVGGEKLSSADNDKDKVKGEMKESWRKSDSTMSHHTIRAAGTSRTSRPVSMAESFQSAHTIVPSANTKRLSTLTTDMDFGMPEEEDEGSFKSLENVSVVNPSNTGMTLMNASVPSSAYKTSPPSSIRSKNRRSLSLNLGLSSTKPQIAPTYVNVSAHSNNGGASAAEPKYFSHSISEGQSATISSSSLNNATRSPYPYPSPPPRLAMSAMPQPQQQGNNVVSGNTNLRGRFAAWATGSSSNNASSSGASSPIASRNILPPLPPVPSASPTMLTGTPSQSSGNNPPSSSLRQTAISMTSSFAPAAGLAKRAVEKMGRKWGMGISSSSSGSGYSSSSSSKEAHEHSSSSHTDYQGSFIGRTNSNQSSIATSMQSAGGGGGTGGIHHHIHLPHLVGGNSNHHHHHAKMRRTPNAPSGSYSVTSSVTSNSTSDSDGFFPPVGPLLGTMVRGPVRNRHGGAVLGGVVFGRELKGAVNQTKIGVGVAAANNEEKRVEERRDRVMGERERLVKDLEERMLPALVARCAQHIVIWGVQEEGLFRVNGRASHVSKLRAEFDIGVDYDMTDCAPGDLDPYAVASVFKAYLRELPEAILTYKLHPLFDAAVSKELDSRSHEPFSLGRNANRGRGLPAGPKGTFPMPLRKPPSLSTLAMPSFSAMPPPSKALVETLKSLIARLPLENRDLIRTTVELMRITARASKETKMPLSNLLLVFTPSLNMSPPLLRALCEAEGIWDDVQQDDVLDIRRHTVVPADASSNTSDKKDGSETDEEDFSDAQDGLEAERSSVQSSDRALSDHPSSEYHASAESASLLEESGVAQRRRNMMERPEIPTVYLDSHSRCSSSSVSSLQEPVAHFRDGAFADVRSVSSSGSYAGKIALTPSPPPLSCSAGSFDSPISSRHSSFVQLPVDDVKDAHGLFQHPKLTIELEALKIVDTSPLSLQPTSKRQMISNPLPIETEEPVQFPRYIPATSIPGRRRSIPVLRLPSFSPISPPSIQLQSPAESATSARGPRTNRPSLRRLFTKRSDSSLASKSHISPPFSYPYDGSTPYINAPRSASDSSVSTPRSAVTAPQSSTSLLPPVLDTPIENSSFRFELGLDLSPTGSAENVPANTTITSTADTSLYVSAPTSQVSLHSPISPGDNHIRMHPTNRQRLASTSSSNHLGVLEGDDDDEDWTQSVLIAAGADGKREIQQSA